MGWARPSPAQTGHWPKPVTRLGKGTHNACVLSEGIIKSTETVSNELNCRIGKEELTWSAVLDNEDEAAGD